MLGSRRRIEAGGSESNGGAMAAFMRMARALGSYWRQGLVATAVVLLFACAAPDKVKEAPQPEALPLRPVPPPADGRVIVEASEYPWSAIGRVNTGGRGHCTGLLIGPRHVLASAPCLYYSVEARWWHHSEVHFVAGYQRDTYQANSRVAAYDVAPEFAPGGLTLASLANNWALITLKEPIGRRTGWLGLQKLDRAARSRIRLGEATVLPVGYRRGRAHVITLNLGCNLSGPVQTASGMTPDCEVLPYDAGLPPLIFADGVFRALGERLPDGGSPADGPLARALLAAGVRSFEGKAPARAGAVSLVPLVTIDRFLAYLGYLVPAAAGAANRNRDAERAAAIREFQTRNGLPMDGRPSVALLGYLIRAVQPAPAVSQRAPSDTVPALASVPVGRGPS